MSFPASPSNGQLATVNNITYVYSSASNSWTRSVSSNVTVGGFLAATSVKSDTYQYANGSPVATTIALAAGSGSGTATLGSTLTLTGGTGVTTSASGSAFTITNSGVTGLSSSGIGNITVSASTGAVTLALPATGPGATSAGSASVIPVITTDAYGRVTALTTVSPTFASVTKSGTTGTGDIGQSNNTFGTVYATTFSGVSTTAKYADLAEVYVSDKNYEPGTVVVFGGPAEITSTRTTHDTRVAGVISTNPAYLMNSEAVGLPVAFTGRVPCKVRGPVSKGDVLVSSAYPEYAERLTAPLYNPGCILGKSLGEVAANEFATIEVVVGRF
jgi:hypothetical protein